MPRFRVIPYRAGSQSARALAEGLGGMRLRINGNSRFRPRADDVIINWGHADPPLYGNNVLNGRTANPLRPVTNKLQFFQTMEGWPWLPEFWTNREDIPDEAFPIVCRTVLAGHSGDGIVIANTRDELVQAPLYVKYIKKVHEYRIHVGRQAVDVGGNLMRGDTVVISQQQKRRRTDVPDEEVNWQVRNHHNGFIYAREDVHPPQCVIDAAKEALASSGLDFGAVDVVFNQRQERAYVLEINTAPGLEGTTLTDYVNFFRGN